MGVEQRISPPEFIKVQRGFMTLIADDEIDIATRTEDAIQQGFGSGDMFHGKIQVAQNVMDLLNSALYGNDGKQADVVLLDDQYSVDSGNWFPKDEDLMALAQRAVIDFNPYLAQGYDYKDMPKALHKPSSIHFAMLLRIFGFTNNIFVVSSAPPSVEQITAEVEALSNFTEKYKKVFPINGFTQKKPYRGNIFFANTIEDGSWNNQMVAGGLAQSLQGLFTVQPAR